MINFISELRRIVLRRTPDGFPSEKMEFIKFRKSLSKALSRSRKDGTVVGIYSDVLGEGMFVTAVDDIYSYDKEEIITLKPYDLSGVILKRTTIALSEIRAICVFDIPYKNPIFS